MIHLRASLLVFFALISISTAPATGQDQKESGPCGRDGTPVASPGATPVVSSESRRIDLESGEALLWPAGERGVLLLHGAAYDAASWEPQATLLASHGYTVLSLETLSAESVLEGIEFLADVCGVSGVTVVGASAGGASALDALANDPEGVTGLVLLGATGDVETLGDYPKLFTASDGEGLADSLQTMAESAPGDANEALILPGTAHAQAIFDTGQGEALFEAMLSFLEDTVQWDAP